jgi:ATP-dependent helicase IRC3
MVLFVNFFVLITSSDHEAHFEAHFTPAMLHKGTAAAFKTSPFLRSRKVLTAVNLSDAVRGCDTYAKTKVVFGPMALGFVPRFR